MPKFSSSLPIIIYDRPAGSNELWQDFDRGPGFFDPRPGYEIHIRTQNIDNQDLNRLVEELIAVPELAYLNLSENRRINDSGLEVLGQLTQLKGLNLSSCDITGPGLSFLTGLTQLESLNLSYCNRIADLGIRMVKSLTSLTYLDLQGCVKITRGGMSKIDRTGLIIHYK